MIESNSSPRSKVTASNFFTASSLQYLFEPPYRLWMALAATFASSISSRFESFKTSMSLSTTFISSKAGLTFSCRDIFIIIPTLQKTRSLKVWSKTITRVQRNYLSFVNYCSHSVLWRLRFESTLTVSIQISSFQVASKKFWTQLKTSARNSDESNGNYALSQYRILVIQLTAFNTNSSFSSIERLLTELHKLLMNLVKRSFIQWNSQQATDSSIERLARSLMIFVNASSRLPVVNS